MFATTATNGVCEDASVITTILHGQCPLCGASHSGFGHDVRLRLWLASCGCGAIYRYGEAPTPPTLIRWYRSVVRR